MITTVLSIAGTDPTGGAGLLADIKTISALGGYALAVPTAIIAQNSRRVRAIWPLTESMICAQLESVEEEFPLSAIKIGLLPGEEAINALVPFLSRQKKSLPVVLDPVLKASAGQNLSQNEAIRLLKELILPHIHVMTPNLYECAVLLGTAQAKSRDDMIFQAKELGKIGHFWVLLKGGHLENETVSPDVLVGPDKQEYWFESSRIATRHGRGTGCTLSSALAFYLSRYDIYDAVKHAKKYLYKTLLNADKLNLVKTRGPLNHFGYMDD